MSLLIALMLPLLLGGCAETRMSQNPEQVRINKNFIARYPGVVKVGEPYMVDGKWYYPASEDGYEETGEASWYGNEFHGRFTANGERYDQDGLTAAHKTLPLPSIVRVTNLETGQVATIRVNDRGPFKSGRVIDLSRGSAKALGIIGKGTAKVRVQYLKEETEAYLANLLRARGGGVMVASSSTPPPVMVEDEAAPVAEVASRDLMPQAVETTEQHSFTDPAPLPPAPAASQQYPADMPFKVVKVTEVTKTTTASAKAPPPQKIVPGVLFIQVGSFGLKSNADKAKATLSKLGQINLMPVEMQGKTLYRVRLLPNKSESREAVLKKVADLGYPGARIMHD